MASMRNIVVFALFCGIASAAWGPSNLVVDIGDNKGDFVDIKLQWEVGTCPLALYHVFAQTPTTDKQEVGRTSGASFVIENQEFWTHYTVTLQTSFCLVNDPLVSEIVTGPGSESDVALNYKIMVNKPQRANIDISNESDPHKVVSIETETSATAANVTVGEAHMPRIVDLYNVTYCSSSGCERQIIARNSPDRLGKPTGVKTSLKPLTPNTIYNISVVPEIAYEQKRYSGEAVVSVFLTTKN